MKGKKIEFCSIRLNVDKDKKNFEKKMEKKEKACIIEEMTRV